MKKQDKCVKCYWCGKEDGCIDANPETQFVAACFLDKRFIDFHEQCNSGGEHHGQSGRFMEVV